MVHDVKTKCFTKEKYQTLENSVELICLAATSVFWD